MLDKVFQFFKWAKGVYEGSEALKAIYTVFTVVTAVVGVKGFLQARQMMAKGQDIMANKTAAGGKIPVIYGTRRVGCQVVYMDTAQNRSKDLFVVYALSVGECSEIVPSSIEIDGNSILDGNIYKGGGYVGSDRNGQTGFSHHQPLNTASQVGDVQYSNAGTLGTNPALRYSFVFNLHHGASSQTADPMLRASIPTEWTTNHKLNGICYIAAAFDYDKKGMYKGVPQITVQVKGKKVYDPRESDHTFGDPSTYEWSSNPALCFLDYITNDEYGKGLAESQINMTAIGTAADKCNTKVDQPYYNGSYQDVTWSGDSGDDFIVIDDNADWWQNKVDEFIDIRDVNDTSIFSDDITIKGSTRYEFYDDTQENRLYIDGTLSSTYTNEAGSAKAQVKRFHCNGYIDTNKNVMDNAKELLANMRGILNYVNGKYELQIEDTGTSTFSITDDHIIADAGISVDYGNKDKKANKVVIEFFNANKKYELDTATVLHDASPEYYSDDGEVLEIKAEFPYVTDPYIAYNMGKAILTRSRNQTTMQFLGTPEMYKLNVGDIVDLTYSGLGFSAKPCRVEALELQANGLVSVSLIEYFDVYTWEVPAQESVEILAKIPTIGAIHPPEANSIVFTDTDDSPINRPTLTWTEPTDFPVKEFRVDVEDTSNPPVQVFSKLVNTNSVDLSFLPTGNYNAIITSINGVGIESADVTKAFTIGDPPTATADIQDDAVVTDKITDDAITTPKILDNAVTDAKINSLTANKITAGTIDASVITVTNLDADNITSGSIGADKITVDDLSAINSDLGDIDAGSLNIGSGAFVVTTAGAMTATSADVVGNLQTGNLVVTGDAGIHGEVRATSITAETVTVESIKQEVWNEIDRRTAPAQNGFYDDFSSTGTDGYYVGVAKNFDLLGTNDNGYQINSNDIDLRAGMVTGFATSTNYTGTALEATFQYFYKLASDSTWTALTPTYVGTTDKYTTPDGYFYELDADPSHRINSGTLTAESYYHFRLTVTPTVTNNVWTDSDAGSGYKVEYGVQQSSTGTGAGTGTVTSVSGGDGITASPSSITTTGSLAVDSTVVRTTGTQTLGGNKTFSDNVVIQGNLDVQGTTTTIDTANLDVKDKNITLNYGTGDTSANANGAGITIQDAVSATQDATLTWNTANDSFNFSHPLNVTGNISSSSTVTASSFSASSSGYGTIELGGVSGAYIDLKRPNTDDFDLRLITSGTGGQINAPTGATIGLQINASDILSVSSTGIDVTGAIDASGNVTTTGHYIADTHFRSSDSNATLSATGGGGVYLRPDGNSNSANQVYIESGTGNATFAGTITSGLITVNNVGSDKKISFNRTGGKNISIEHDPNQIYFWNNTDSHFLMKMSNAGLVQSKVGFGVNDTTVIDSSRNLTNIGTITSGDIDVSATNTNGLSIIDSSNSSASPLIKVQGNRQDANESQSFTGGLALSALQTNALANDGKHIGTIYFGTNHTNGTAGNIAYSASISARLSGAANSATDMPTDLVFYTGSSGTSLGTANTTFGTQALKLDSSQNATFAGTISSSSITSTANNYQLRLRRADSADDDWKFYSWESGLNIFPASASTVFFGRDGATTDVSVYNGSLKIGTTTVIDSSRNLTNIGTISSGAIGVNGDITLTEGDKIKTSESSGGSHLLLRSDNLGVTSNSLSLIGLNDILIGSKSNQTGTGNIYFGYNAENKASGSGWVDTLTITDSGNFEFNNGNFTEVGTISSGAIASSASITASGNSNNFGNTTIAALSATSGTFSASITASGNSNSFGNSSFGTISSGRVTTSEDLRFSGTPRIRSDNEINFLTIAGAAQTGKFLSVTAQTAYNGNSASSGMFNALNGYAVGTGNGTTVIDSSRNLTNIGTISSGAITATSGNAGATSYAVITDNNGASGTTVAGFGFANGGALKSSITAAVYGNDYMTFNVGGSGTTERMRLNSTGVLLVGKTSANDFASAGVQIEPAGQITTSIASDTSLRLNRGGTDGTIIELNKAGATVGSIGTVASNIYLGTGDTGIYFNASEDKIYPINTSTIAGRDNAIDLGKSDTRFKDLHLSGTARSNTVSINGTTVIDSSRNLTNLNSITLNGSLGTWSVDNQGAIMNFSRNTANYIKAGSTGGYLVFQTSGANTALTLDGSQNATFSGTISSGAITLADGSHLQAYTSNGTTGTGGVDLPRGGHITFYGNNNVDHSIGSRNHVGNVTDDLRISSYGALYIDLDSNDNNSSSADFVIGRHGSGTGTMSTLVTISGEDGSYTSSGTITSGNINIDASGTSERYLQIGTNTTANHYAYIDLVGDTTYSDYGLRIIRNNGGANTSSFIYHRGTGNFNIETQDSASILLRTAGQTALTIDSSQNATFAGSVTSSSGGFTATIGGIHVADGVTFGQPDHFLGDEGGQNDSETLLLRNGASASGNSGIKILAGYNDGGDTSGKIQLYTNGSTSSPKLEIDIDGNIKMGSTTVIDSSRNLTNIVGLSLSGAILGTSSNFDIRATGNLFYTYGNSSSVFFRTNDGATKLTIDNSGNATFAGTISSGAITANHSKSSTANPILALKNTSTTNEGRYLQFNDNAGVNIGQIGHVDQTESNIFISTFDTGLKFESYITYKAILPCGTDGADVDNIIDLGSSSVRFDDIYATNGTIQTSDRNEKQDIQALTDAEQRVATACKGLIRRFRWQDSVAEKDDNPDSDETARYHFGVIAQDLQDAFTAEGLDAGDYGMFISSTWTDDDGNEQTRLGVRYNELLAFIISTL